MLFNDEKINGEVHELAARVGQLESILDAIQRRLDVVKDLTDLVAQAQSTAHTAAERAQDALDALEAVAVIPDIVDDLKVAVAHGIEHVERTEARIRATVQRARKQLSEDGGFHPGLEAEAQGLRLFDGGTGEGTGVHAVREGLAQPEQDVSEALTDKLRALGLSA